MLIDMRQLQRFLIGKDFRASSRLTESIKSGKEKIEELERRRLHLLTLYPLPHSVRVEDVRGEQLVAYFPTVHRRKIRVLLSQIKEIITHIRLLSQSIARFSSAIGEAMNAAFEELVSANEYTYAEDGNPQSRAHCALLYDQKQ